MCTQEEQTALHYAAFYGHLEVVQLLVEHGVPLDIPDKYGRLAHCSAAINGHLDVVAYLVEECRNPIDINAIDEVCETEIRLVGANVWLIVSTTLVVWKHMSALGGAEGAKRSHAVPVYEGHRCTHNELCTFSRKPADSDNLRA
jgi:hypothetical protein